MGSMVELVVIAVAAVSTSVLSAVAGLGGGIILLVVLAQFFAPATAIPLQSAVQFVANGSRAAMIRDEISWPAVGWSTVLVFPGALLGVRVATALPEDVMRVLLGAFVLVVGWRPSLLRWSGGRPLPDRAMLPVGGAAGFINATAGASGPFTAPFFKAVTATHTAFVATAAASQVIAHTSKLGAYSLADFRLGDHVAVIVVGAIGVTIGSRIGTRLLGRASPEQLEGLFKVVLTALALRLIVGAVL
ncbi:MAG: sulfite exporter TauE/SafE family protein [Actinomycetota bacterium]